MSHARTKKHAALEKTERHLALVRLSGAALLFSMAGFDGKLKGDFDFPAICYIISVGVILGLDMPKIVKFIAGRK